MKYIIRFLAILAILINILVIGTTKYSLLNLRTFRASNELSNLNIQEGNLILTYKKDSYNQDDIVIVKEMNNFFTGTYLKIEDNIITLKTNNETVLVNKNDTVGKVILVIDDKIIIVNLIFDIVIFGLLLFDLFYRPKKNKTSPSN